MEEQAAAQNFDEVRKRMNAGDADADEVGGDAELEEDDGEGASVEDADIATTEGAFPPWVKLPDNLVLPEGKQVFAVRFRAALTDYPGKGERQCIMWNLTEADEKLALKRTRGDYLRSVDEMAKQMVRAIDGKRVNWVKDGVAENPNVFWTDIGGACRTRLKDVYAKRHSMKQDDLVDFFANCVVARTIGT